jgi:hypothetical protein
MRLIACACLTIALLACAGCSKANGYANGGGTDSGSHGRAGISLPF